MGIKGTTIIELTNVNTGVVERVESENTFQTAPLNRVLNNMGMLKIGYMSTKTYSDSNFWQDLLGGILLFDRQIEVGTEYVPDGVNMVGNGAYNVVNTDEPNELGSWNTAESSVDQNTITMVYDFTTSQGNGTINSICLTHYNSGLGGYGNKMNVRRASSGRSNINFTYNKISNFNANVHMFNYIDNDGYVYNITTNANVLIINKYWGNLTKFDLIRNYSNKYNVGSYQITLPNTYQTYTTYKPGLNTTNYTIERLNDTTFAVIRCDGNTVATSSNFKVIKIDIATQTISDEYTIPIKSGLISDSNRSFSSVSGTNNLYMYQSHTTDGEYYVSIYDAENSRWIKDSLDYNGNTPTNTNLSSVCLVGGRFYYYYGYLYGNENACLYTDNGSSLLVTNFNSPMLSNGSNGYITYLSNSHLFIDDCADGASIVPRLYYPVHYLATINNLPSALVKNSEKTMKITYILSRVQE